MSDDKPMNAMYGQKVKLDLNKIKNRSKKEEPVTEEVPDVVVEESVVDDVSDVVVDEAVVEESVVEDVSDAVVDEAVVEDVPDEIAEETVEEIKDTQEKVSESIDFKVVDDLKNKLAAKENKLSNQSNELNYLTNKVIPRLKRENSELKQIKIELTDALEKSTRKYFDQLDINADLSNQIGKLGAEGAVNKVRADKFESEIEGVKTDLQSKIDYYKEKLDNVNVEDLEKENKKLSGDVSDLKEKLSDSRKENISLSDEVDKLRAELIEVGNYKEEVDAKSKKEIDAYKEEISSLKTQLKLKESSYDKLSNENGKTISDLRKQVKRLEDSIEKESNKGLFNRFK